MRYVTRPLTTEARARLQGVRREGSPFSASWSSTLELLDRELWHLGVRNEFVLQIDCTEADLRLDGQLRANARTASPAVGVSIESRKMGALLFVCGKFPQWQDNVRAIALGLEALRKVDRYGITQSAEQYRGWQALPPGMPMPAAKMTVDEAAELLIEHGGITGEGGIGSYVPTDLINNPERAGRCYRNAVKTHHPDVGGNPETFRKLTDARDLLAGAR